MNYKGQDSKTVYSFARIVFCSKYISFALLELLSTQTFVLLPVDQAHRAKIAGHGHIQIRLKSNVLAFH